MYSKTVPIMGTFVQIKIDSSSLSRADIELVYENVLREARRLAKIFDIFDSESEINRLNQTGSGKVSFELFDLVEKSCRISGMTNGAFDITVAPILKANGFYGYMPDKIRESIPNSINGVGWKNISLDAGKNMISVGKDTWLDASGIAKGYIVDGMALFLRNNGINNFLINAGGDIYCSEKQNSGTWLIGVRRPSSEEILVTLNVKNQAVATSGDYENVVIDKASGEKLSHIIVPADARAKEQVFYSITVIAPSCTEADALATGMMAMGTEKAIELAGILEKIEIIAVEGLGKNEKISFSKAARKYIS